MKHKIPKALLSLSLAITATHAAALTIEENQAGFCSADGIPAESINQGFTGDGYINVVNASDSRIVWSVQADTSGARTLQLRFANGDTSNRSATISINGSSYQVSLAPTDSWSSWQTESITVHLNAGDNIIQLTANESNGLANIDSLSLSGNDLAPGSCDTPTPVAKTARSLVTGCKGESSGLSAEKVYYVTPNGSSSANGNRFSSAMDFSTALSKVKAGEMILLQPGTYPIAYKGSKNTINFSKSGTSKAPISVVAANCGRAVFDFSFPEQEWIQNSFGFYVTGDYWYFKGIEITRAGYQGAYVTGDHNTFENTAFHHNRNTGLEINKGGSNTTVINSDAYFNYDPKKQGSMADGFGPKQTQGPGNKFYGCRAWNNSDDGFDIYDSKEKVIIENSWAFNNGVDTWDYGGFRGNGNGFKLGGNHKAANHLITHSVAFGNPYKGFDQNNNAGGITVINNTSYQNGINYGFGNNLNSGQKHYFSNNISLSGKADISNANASHNSWNKGFAVSKSDFLSLKLNNATIDRNPDGTLPYTSLFRLSPNSKLIDAGKKENLPYQGKAPDLGAFERQ